MFSYLCSLARLPLPSQRTPESRRTRALARTQRPPLGLCAVPTRSGETFWGTFRFRPLRWTPLRLIGRLRTSAVQPDGRVVLYVSHAMLSTAGVGLGASGLRLSYSPATWRAQPTGLCMPEPRKPLRGQRSPYYSLAPRALGMARLSSEIPRRRSRKAVRIVLYRADAVPREKRVPLLVTCVSGRPTAEEFRGKMRMSWRRYPGRPLRFPAAGPSHITCAADGPVTTECAFFSQIRTATTSTRACVAPSSSANEAAERGRRPSRTLYICSWPDSVTRFPDIPSRRPRALVRPWRGQPVAAPGSPHHRTSVVSRGIRRLRTRLRRTRVPGAGRSPCRAAHGPAAARGAPPVVRR